MERGEHLGLLGMRERAESLGGSFQVVSSPGQGTRVQVLLPIPEFTSRGDEAGA
ncbi:ATP-binding protein [Deinococcus koreensis]|uniref:ATP-binding protein n=1 Tax=Deinococcus koreensis TaxID=2054903 RepID=UPI003C308E12